MWHHLKIFIDEYCVWHFSEYSGINGSSDSAEFLPFLLAAAYTNQYIIIQQCCQMAQKAVYNF